MPSLNLILVIAQAPAFKTVQNSSLVTGKKKGVVYTWFTMVPSIHHMTTAYIGNHSPSWRKRQAKEKHPISTHW